MLDLAPLMNKDDDGEEDGSCLSLSFVPQCGLCGCCA
jgi:hypothetical protein